MVQDVLRERKTMSQLASEHGVDPTVIRDWREVALKGLPSLFERGRSSLESEREAHQKRLEELYAEIGRLTTQVGWLKRKAGLLDE